MIHREKFPIGVELVQVHDLFGHHPDYIGGWEVTIVVSTRLTQFP